MIQKNITLQLKEEEKIKQQTEELTKKLLKMNPQQRRVFFESLTQKLNKINKQLENIETDINKIETIDKKRELSVIGETLTIMVPFTISSFLAGVGVFQLLKVSDAFFIAFISSATSLLSSVILSTVLSMLACCVVGMGVGVLSDVAIKNKVVSNFVSKIKVKILESKIKNLQNSKKQILQKLDIAEGAKTI